MTDKWRVRMKSNVKTRPLCARAGSYNPRDL